MSLPSMPPPSSESSPDELVLGVVAPLGTDLSGTIRALGESLVLVGYTLKTIRLSEILKSLDLGIELREEPEGERLRSFMEAGTAARRLSKRADILALGAMNRINETRASGGEVMQKTAHLLLTLKHPEEVRTLRRIYGPGFYLIGVSSSKADRTSFLVQDKKIPRHEAEQLVQHDEEELESNDLPNDWGQKTRDTFHLADVFVRAGERSHVARFLDLVFGDPFQTPSPEEHAMFMAYASSLRSADLSRQVGAVVLSKSGDLIATGANDVAAPGGGLYWPGDGDERDFKRGKDVNEQRRNDFVIDVVKRLSPDEKETDRERLARGKKLLEGSPIFDITEFGRAVHAEMEALLACARSGVSPRGGTVVCTTFPCHNCAKHIVVTGVAKVIYVEPYPKSQAYDLFPESVVLEDLVEKKDLSDDRRVRFSPFCGVGPRRYFDLFSLGLSSGYKIKRKQEGGAKFDWTRATGRVRVPMLPNSYLEREKLASNELVALSKKLEERHERNQEKPQH